MRRVPRAPAGPGSESPLPDVVAGSPQGISLTWSTVEAQVSNTRTEPASTCPHACELACGSGRLAVLIARADLTRAGYVGNCQEAGWER